MSHQQIDPYKDAAYCEAISFIIRRDLRVVRDGVKALDSFWLDLEDERDVVLLFDKP